MRFASSCPVCLVMLPNPPNFGSCACSLCKRHGIMVRTVNPCGDDCCFWKIKALWAPLSLSGSRQERGSGVFCFLLRVCNGVFLFTVRLWYATCESTATPLVGAHVREGWQRMAPCGKSADQVVRGLDVLRTMWLCRDVETFIFAPETAFSQVTRLVPCFFSFEPEPKCDGFSFAVPSIASSSLSCARHGNPIPTPHSRQL